MTFALHACKIPGDAYRRAVVSCRAKSWQGHSNRHGTPHTPDEDETRERVFAYLSLAAVVEFVGSDGLEGNLLYIRESGLVLSDGSFGLASS